MITARSVDGEHVGIEVRCRIAACRKRLRHYRTTRSAPVTVEIEQVPRGDKAPAIASGEMSGPFESEEGER